MIMSDLDVAASPSCQICPCGPPYSYHADLALNGSAGSRGFAGSSGIIQLVPVVLLALVVLVILLVL